ncbi:hypothetical protein PAEPH01_1521 [Pancytospora epiphaga]|nr:hypothetical protein PAEPH01_1521 [Pancytospora epiphaga]
MRAVQIPGKKISWVARYTAPIARSGGIRFNFFRAILTQEYFEHRNWLDYNEHMFLIKTYGELETTLLWIECREATREMNRDCAARRIVKTIFIYPSMPSINS